MNDEAIDLRRTGTSRPSPAGPTKTPQRVHRTAFLSSDRTRFGVFVFFLLAVFLMGGGSRANIASLPFLRPVCFFLIAYAISVAEAGQIRSLGAPLFLLSALAVLILVQLVPLPPAVWSSLPGRDIYAEALRVAGLGDAWRPLSLSPAATLNSLLALSAPFAALLLYAVQGPGYRRRTLWAVCAMGIFSALWGLLQLTGSPAGPLYFYNVTNDGLPVGLFANRNHQAVFLAGLIPLVAYLGLTTERARGAAAGASFFSLGVILLLSVTILMTGSRAGLLATAIAFAGAALVMRFRQVSAPKMGASRFGLDSRVLIMAALAAVLLLAAAMIWFGRVAAVERLFSAETVEELRGQLLPVLANMAGAFFPVGAGFGAFDAIYDRFEPVSVLSERYLNQAHNDWLQVIIEGGALAGLLLVAFLLWVGRQVRHFIRDWRSGASGGVRRRAAAAAFLLIFAMASLFDYPLRVPSLMAVFIIVCVVLGDDRREPSGSR